MLKNQVMAGSGNEGRLVFESQRQILGVEYY